MHHLQEVEGMSLQSVRYCVFDEADQLFEMGFAEQLRAVLSGMGDARQTLLFSATLPAALAEFARAGVFRARLCFPGLLLLPLPCGHLSTAHIGCLKPLLLGLFDLHIASVSDTQVFLGLCRPEEPSLCASGC